jgi:hypothetical protein
VCARCFTESCFCSVVLVGSFCYYSHGIDACGYFGFDQCSRTCGYIFGIRIWVSHGSETTGAETPRLAPTWGILQMTLPHRDCTAKVEPRVEQAIELPLVTRLDSGRGAFSSAYLSYGPPKFGGSLRWARRGGGT